MICKPDRRVIYSGCQWSKIGESGTPGGRSGGEGHRGGLQKEWRRIYDHSRLAAAAHGPGGARQPTGRSSPPSPPSRRWKPGGRLWPWRRTRGAGPLRQRLPGGPGVRKGEADLPLGQGGAGGLWAGGDRDPGPAVGGLEPEEGLGPDLAPGRLEALKAQLADLPWQRLQWRGAPPVRALPTEGRARAMTRERTLWCAANLLLDGEEAWTSLSAPYRQEAEAGRVPGVRPGCLPDRPRDQPRL